MNKQESTQWPMLAVEYWGTREPVIMSIQQAVKEYDLPENYFKDMVDGHCVGIGLRSDHPARNSVERFRLYTAKDCAEDAAMEMLAALQNVLGQLDLMPDDIGSLSMFNTTVHGRPTKAALAIREGLRAEVTAAIQKATMNP